VRSLNAAGTVPVLLIDGSPNRSSVIGRVLADDVKFGRFKLPKGTEINGARLRELADQEEALRLSTRLAAAQIQPHFLFNTLNSIASMVRRKPEAAEEMIGCLSDFLRMTLDTAHEHEVPLRREVEFLDRYLEIQEVRFGDRLRIQKQIEPSTLEVAVPALLLQPLVENAVRHAVESRETGGTILIRSLRDKDSLRVEVRDDGEGLKRQMTALRDGIGLSNTKTRLQELYGEAHRFQILPNPGGGLTVVVALPWRVMASS